MPIRSAGSLHRRQDAASGSTSDLRQPGHRSRNQVAQIGSMPNRRAPRVLNRRRRRRRPPARRCTPPAGAPPHRSRVRLQRPDPEASPGLQRQAAERQRPSPPAAREATLRSHSPWGSLQRMRRCPDHGAVVGKLPSHPPVVPLPPFAVEAVLRETSRAPRPLRRRSGL